jgi:hypothetical protein
MILTNNPKVLSSYPGALWIDGGPLEVIMECRRMVHEGYPLLAHPLMGDIYLIRNPFRTVILAEKKEEIDLASLTWIEESAERIRLFYRRDPNFHQLEDYQDIDFDLFQRVKELITGH